MANDLLSHQKLKKDIFLPPPRGKSSFCKEFASIMHAMHGMIYIYIYIDIFALELITCCHERCLCEGVRGSRRDLRPCGINGDVQWWSMMVQWSMTINDGDQWWWRLQDSRGVGLLLQDLNKDLLWQALWPQAFFHQGRFGRMSSASWSRRRRCPPSRRLHVDASAPPNHVPNRP